MNEQAYRFLTGQLEKIKAMDIEMDELQLNFLVEYVDEQEREKADLELRKMWDIICKNYTEIREIRQDLILSGYGEYL